MFLHYYELISNTSQILNKRINAWMYKDICWLVWTKRLAQRSRNSETLPSLSLESFLFRVQILFGITLSFIHGLTKEGFSFLSFFLFNGSHFYQLYLLTRNLMLPLKLVRLTKWALMNGMALTLSLREIKRTKPIKCEMKVNKKIFLRFQVLQSLNQSKSLSHYVLVLLAEYSTTTHIFTVYVISFHLVSVVPVLLTRVGLRWQ